MKRKMQTKHPHGQPSQDQKSVENLCDFCSESTDPQGSYTGRPADPYEKPVQDADDL